MHLNRNLLKGCAAFKGRLVGLNDVEGFILNINASPNVDQ